MNAQELIGTAKALVADEKGLLATDETNPTGFGDLQRRGSEPGTGAASRASSSQMQPGRAPRRIHRRNGGHVSIPTGRTIPRPLILALLLASSLVARADDDAVAMPELVQGAEQWMQENLDTNVLNALPEVDERAVQQFFREVQRRFQGDYVVDLAALRQTAKTVLPLLESREETRPYAAWLRAQMDYLDVADEIRLTMSPPKVETNLPPRLVPNPPPQMEREIWVRKVSGNPWPVSAKEYVPELKRVFAAQQVPTELVWLAEAESSFDRRALSPAGAAGLFQLMPDTAKRFGLSLWPRDQRFQPEPSAAASARYLKSLYDHFKDWRLALAAYNAGEGAVQKLLDRFKTGNYDAIAEHLPAETQLYVPRVEAILLEREGVTLEQLSLPRLTSAWDRGTPPVEQSNASR